MPIAWLDITDIDTLLQEDFYQSTSCHSHPVGVSQCGERFHSNGTCSAIIFGILALWQI